MYKGMPGNDKLSAIYTVTLLAAKLYIVNKFHFPTSLFPVFPYLLFPDFPTALHIAPRTVKLLGFLVYFHVLISAHTHVIPFPVR